jgi:hypothetical protein
MHWAGVQELQQFETPEVQTVKLVLSGSVLHHGDHAGHDTSGPPLAGVQDEHQVMVAMVVTVASSGLTLLLLASEQCCQGWRARPT